MSFCTKCGTQVEDDLNFCPKCGTQILREDSISIPNKNIDNLNNIEQSPIPSTKVGKINKVIIISIISIILALGFIFFLIGKSQTNVNSVIKNFQSGVATRDISKIKECVSSDDVKLDLSDENLNVLIEYINSNPSYFNEVISDLQKQKEKLDINDSALANNSKYTFYLSPSNKFLLFFTKYKISINSFYINVAVKYKDADVSLNNKSICKSDSDNFNTEIGPLVPGKYKIKASYKGNYVTCNDMKEVDVVKNSEDNKASISLLDNLKYIDITSDEPDTKLFSNEKDTGIIINETLKYGPVTPDTKVLGMINKDGKPFRSNEVTVGNNSAINLSFESLYNYNSLQYQINDLIQNYTSAFAYAVNYNDFSSIEGYLYPGSNIYNQQMKTIADYYSRNIGEEWVSSTIEDLQPSADSTEGSVKVTEAYKITKNGITKLNTYSNFYTFKLDKSSYTYKLTDLK